MVDGLGGDVEKPYQKLSKEEDIKKIRFPILAMLYLSLCTGWMDGWMASFTPTSPLKGYAGYLTITILISLLYTNPFLMGELYASPSGL